MNFAFRQAIKIFFTGIIILIIAITVFYRLNYNNILSFQLNESRLVANEISEYINQHIINEVDNTNRIADNTVITDALTKSNSYYQALSEKTRKNNIEQTNRKWKTIKDKNHSFILNYTDNEAAKYLKIIQHHIKGEYGEIFLTNKYGALVASTAKLTTFAHGHKYWWKGAYAEGKGAVFLDDRGYDESVNGYVLGIVVPIKKGNEIIGILKANLNILEMIHESNTTTKKNTNKLKLIRSGGLIIFEEGVEPLSQRISDDLKKEIINKSLDSFVFENEESKYIIGVADIKISSGMKGYNFGGSFESIDHKKGNSGESWQVLILNHFSKITSQTQNIVSQLWIMGFLFTLIFAITSLLIGKRTAKPLQILIKQTEQIIKGNYDFKIITNRKDEIGKLANSFNQMTSYLKDSTTSISTLNAAYQQLAASELSVKSEKEFSENLLETANSFILVLDINANITLFNKFAENLTGYKKDEVLGKNWVEIFIAHPPEKSELQDVFDKILNDSSAYSSYENSVLCKNNSEILIRWENTVIKDKKGNPSGILSIGNDITKQAEAEEKLKQSEEKLRLVIEQSPLGICVNNLDGTFISANPAYEKLLGYNEEELKKLTFFDITHPDDCSENKHLFHDMTFGGSTSFNMEKRYIRKDGTQIQVIVHAGPICSSSGSPIFGLAIVEDITEKKKYESQLLKMEKLQSIGTLAGGIAHDFNNILTGIYGNVSLALLELDESHPSHRFLNQTEESLNRATQLTRQLLTFSKGSVLVKKDVNLTKLIQDIVIFDLSGSNVKPEFYFAEDLHKVKGDKGQLQQVFSNLAINANQASPEGGHLFINATNCVINDNDFLGLDSGDYLKITVEDEGTGIPQKNIDKIFDPYFTTKETGNGLGLATTYSIIQSHKGCLEIDSELGKGTKFTIYLPAAKTEEVEKIEKSEKIIESKHNDAKILIMDDEESIRKMLSQMLIRLGYKVESSSDGKEAISKYEEAIKQDTPFDLVIMDLTIPGGMGGKETVKEILKIDKNAKTIVSSGYSSGGTMADYKSFGFLEMINKPYTIAKLKKVIDTVFNQEIDK